MICRVNSHQGRQEPLNDQYEETDSEADVDDPEDSPQRGHAYLHSLLRDVAPVAAVVADRGAGDPVDLDRKGVAAMIPQSLRPLGTWCLAMMTLLGSGCHTMMTLSQAQDKGLSSGETSHQAVHACVSRLLTSFTPLLPTRYDHTPNRNTSLKFDYRLKPIWRRFCLRVKLGASPSLQDCMYANLTPEPSKSWG